MKVNNSLIGIFTLTLRDRQPRCQEDRALLPTLAALDWAAKPEHAIFAFADIHDCLTGVGQLRNIGVDIPLNPDANRVARHVCGACQTMHRFADEEFLHDLTFDFDAVAAVPRGGVSENLVGRSIPHPDLFTPRGALQFAVRNRRQKYEQGAFDEDEQAADRI